jgi:hypothetical protein
VPTVPRSESLRHRREHIPGHQAGGCRAGEEEFEVFDRCFALAELHFGGAAGDVGREDDVLQAEELMTVREGFGVGDVEGGGEPAGL